MEHQINNDWRLSTDPHCIILEERVPAKKITKGKRAGEMTPETWKPAGYYTSFKSALKALVERKTLETEKIEGVVKAMDELKGYIDSLTFSDDK